MATRSTIAVQHEDGTVSQIYCHYDGYLEHNGQMLLEYYNSALAAEFLVSKGDLSVLAPRVTPTGPHTFDAPEDGVCVYYGRDRGETGTEPKTYASVSEYFDEYSREEYNYFFNGESWEVEQSDRDFMSIAEALSLETEDYE
jgi:hypothetical protein